MSGATQPCGCSVSTIFVFQSPDFQNAANTVYEHKKAVDAYNASAGNNNKYTFKSDYERMQYLMGSYNRNTSCQTSRLHR